MTKEITKKDLCLFANLIELKSIKEISVANGCSESAISKRLTRPKNKVGCNGCSNNCLFVKIQDNNNLTCAFNNANNFLYCIFNKNIDILSHLKEGEDDVN